MRDDEVHTKNDEACPVVQALDTVGTQWRLRVLYALRDSELRVNELKRATGGRSKTVWDALDVLSDSGLVTRRTEEAAPVAVYDKLTDKGEALLWQLDELSHWPLSGWTRSKNPTSSRIASESRRYGVSVGA